MKTKITTLLSSICLISLVMVTNVIAQTSATGGSVTQPSHTHDAQMGPHGGLVCPANDNFRFEMVYNDNAKKIEIYFMNPEGKIVEAANLTGEVTFVSAEKSTSIVNSNYQNNKFTVGVPDGKPLNICGIVLSYNGQMYGGKFVNPSLIK